MKLIVSLRTNDSRDISWYPDSCKGKLLKLVSLTNLFGTLYPRLIERCPGKQILKPICASVPPVLLFLLLFPTLEFYRLEKVFYTSKVVLIFLHESSYILTRVAHICHNVIILIHNTWIIQSAGHGGRKKYYWK